jgi:Ni/Co efflux regulator RcnB
VHPVRIAGIAALALTMGLGPLTQAQGKDRDRDQEKSRDRGDDRRHSNGRGPSDLGMERGNGRGNAQWDQRNPGRGPQASDERRDEMRGAGPNHEFRRGGRLPPQYRSRQYIVEDWRGHRLDAPPRGYQWVQTGGDYVLVAIATGIILQILLNQ